MTSRRSAFAAEHWLAWRVCAYLLLALTSSARAQDTSDACGSLCLLDGANRPLPAAQAALQVSHYVTNGATLTRSDRYDATSLAITDLRVQVADSNLTANAFADVESRTPNGSVRGSLRLPLTRGGAGPAWRSPFLRLVGDEVDRQARGAEDRTLLVALRDSVVVHYANRQLSLRVGRPGKEAGPRAARQARVSVHILRQRPGAKPVIGTSDTAALELMRSQLRVANEIWLQCDLTFGAPDEVAMEIVDPPPAAVLAVADEDGLPASGGGEVRFRIGGQAIGPVVTRAAATPLETANDIALALRASGFYAAVSENLRGRAGAGPSADLVVRRADGALVNIESDSGQPLSSDARQTLTIGQVDLSDGLLEFDNMTAQVGSLEERTLLKTLSDDDASTIDLFVVNQFSNATRQGEAFIAEAAAAIVNTVIIDRNGLRHLPLAWTVAHELGHVLMNDPLHPDNVGPDRPWLLMDSDNGRGTVDGPKRLRDEDCRRVRAAASSARVPLLFPYDPEQPRG
jgi:hypothetical protein